MEQLKTAELVHGFLQILFVIGSYLACDLIYGGVSFVHHLHGEKVVLVYCKGDDRVGLKILNNVAVNEFFLLSVAQQGAYCDDNDRNQHDVKNNSLEVVLHECLPVCEKMTVLSCRMAAVI